MVHSLYDLMGEKYVNPPVSEHNKQMHLSFAIEVFANNNKCN